MRVQEESATLVGAKSQILSHYAECINERARGVRIALAAADELLLNTVPIWNAIRFFKVSRNVVRTPSQSASRVASAILRLAGYAVYRAAMPDTRAICTQLPLFCLAR